LLLIDDDPVLRETLRQLLESLGYTVRTAGGGAEALRILDSGSGFVPQAVLLDVVMPGLAGLPLFVELRKRVPAAPVILISGYSTDQTVIGLLEAGATELVQKPCTIETIAEAIRRNLAASQESRVRSQIP
jgi:DNA-binding NtrC family response regulator